jgi:hypothetical protein
MVITDAPAGVTGLTEKPTVVPAGLPVAPRVTGSSKPSLDPTATS